MKKSLAAAAGIYTSICEFFDRAMYESASVQTDHRRDVELCAPQHNLPPTTGTMVDDLCGHNQRRGGGGGGGRALAVIAGISF
jgi:hypothetical protein